eukprot:PhM_4_TR16164/c0_g1_i1/m.24624
MSVPISDIFISLHSIMEENLDVLQNITETSTVVKDQLQPQQQATTDNDCLQVDHIRNIYAKIIEMCATQRYMNQQLHKIADRDVTTENISHLLNATVRNHREDVETAIAERKAELEKLTSDVDAARSSLTKDREDVETA